MYKKKLLSFVLLGVCSLVLSACSSSTDSKKDTSSSSSSVETAKSADTSSIAKKSKDSYKDGALTVNDVEYKITEAKTYPSASDGKKIIALYLDITNHGSKPADLLVEYNPHTYIHAEQKADNSIKKLNVGIPNIDENGNSVEQERQDVIANDKVTSGSTVQGIMFFELVNDSPVTVTFENSSFDNLGEKTYNLQ